MTLKRRGGLSGLMAGSLVAALASSGCYDEGLTVMDFTGTVKIPKEAARFTFRRPVLDDDGEPVLDPGSGEPLVEDDVVTDVRLIGPVYIGLYASVQTDTFAYPYPETGPVVGSADAQGIGDTYPYGGTTLGDFRYACYEFFQCRMISGRYESFGDIIEWWNDIVGDPILDARGEVVTSADAFRQTCYQLQRWTSDEEVRITGDVDFVDDGADHFVGEFTIPYTEFREGMTAWAFMEKPKPGESGSFSYSGTCNPQFGFQERQYNQIWFAGAQERDVLNRPAAYLTTGDRVSSEGFTWGDDPFEPAELEIDFEVE